jgi:arylsulfatase A-like enzyme
VDAELGKLLSILSEAGLDDSTYRVVLSDHGEDFWDHFGFATHGHSLYEELIHVPLMVRGPDLIPGTRVKERVQLLDVLPTLLELAGVPGPEEKVSGLSFRRLLAGRAGASRPAFSEDHTLFERVAVLSDLGGSPWKLIHSPSIESHEMIPHIRALVDLSRFEGILQEWELFDLATDPGETKNLASSRPRERKALEALLEGFLRDHPLGKAPPGAALDPDIQRRLMELGYTVDPPVPKKEEEADGEGG